MRGLFQQDRAISPASIRSATLGLGVLLSALAGLIILGALGEIFSRNLLAGFIQLAGGLGLLLGFFLIVRLQVEMLWAMHRLNDRLTVMGDDLRHKQQSAPIPAQASLKSGD